MLPVLEHLVLRHSETANTPNAPVRAERFSEYERSTASVLDCTGSGITSTEAGTIFQQSSTHCICVLRHVS